MTLRDGTKEEKSQSIRMMETDEERASTATPFPVLYTIYTTPFCKFCMRSCGRTPNSTTYARNSKIGLYKREAGA
jgi:hypothetical protein